MTMAMDEPVKVGLEESTKGFEAFEKRHKNQFY
jgi:hypothetical protein